MAILKKNSKLTIMVFLLIFSGANYFVGAAEIEETVLGMNVSGNKEAPNLLYIIPWKDTAADATPPEIYRLMDEIYSTVDPDVFEKEVVFYEQLTTAKGRISSKSKND